MKHKLINDNFKSDYLYNLLRSRGVEDVEKFLNPDPRYDIQSPEDLENVEEGFQLLKKHILNKSNICIIVDADVDGFTSAAIAYQFIKDNDPDINIDYIIHEHKAHGLSDCIEQILKENYQLVWVPDAGSNDETYIEELGENNIEVLITDHHILDNDKNIPSNCVLINNQISPKYKNKDLTGSGVTWQFCRYYDTRMGTTFGKKYIDLAVLGIISDMGSFLSIENRVLVKIGLKNITNYLFKCACEKQDYSMGGKINYTSVAFYITPLLNSMIRVGSMPEKERLFLAFVDGHKMVPCNKRGAKGTTEEVAIESLRECTNTKSKQDKITTAALENLSIRIFNNNLLDNKILFVELEDEDDFPQEVNGLVAMKLSSKYKRPTMLGRKCPDNKIKGSIRGLQNCAMGSMREFLLSTNYMDYVEGHDLAAGFSIEPKNVIPLHAFANYALKDINFTEDSYEVEFERYFAANDLKDIVTEIGGVPDLWGQNNKEPLIYIYGINLKPEEIKIMGSRKDTISFEVNGIKYIKFHAEDFINQMNEHDSINLNVVCKASINEWMGRRTPQLMIESYEFVNSNLAF